MVRKWGDGGWDSTEMYGCMDAMADTVSFNQWPEYRKKQWWKVTLYFYSSAVPVFNF